MSVFLNSASMMKIAEEVAAEGNLDNSKVRVGDTTIIRNTMLKMTISLQTKESTDNYYYIIIIYDITEYYSIFSYKQY